MPRNRIRSIQTRLGGGVRLARVPGSIWQSLGAFLGAIAVGIIIVVVAVLFLIPRILGGDSLTVLTGSMEPNLKPGDVVAVRGIAEEDVCADISIGDIVTYFPTPNDPAVITHRVIAKTVGNYDDGTSCRLILQGDANSAQDDPVSPKQVRGVFMYGIPSVGWARSWVEDNKILVFVIFGLLAVGIYTLDRARPRTRIRTIAGVPTPPETVSSPTGDNDASSGDASLRLRELDLRERELALREREVALLEQQSFATATITPSP
ncbi:MULTISPECIES: signal peptidase I [unclassified Microbacterium]|uniref:signal peptidase I n=1 Tax=unclassified Microbacterium TaxID=2609290 RepID=UPI003016330C